ncbi:MAG: GNAT family N-acetyltransferase [Bdellovibrionales bacterium]
MTYRLRCSEVSDTDVLARVAAQAWQETYPSIVPAEALAVAASVEHRAELRRGFFDSMTPDWGMFLAETEQKEVVGFCDCGPSDVLKMFAPSEIFTLYVLRPEQKRGLGKRLFSAMIKHLADKGFESAVLDVFMNNEEARRFYEKRGGVQIAEIRRDVGGVLLPLAVYKWFDLKKAVSANCS